MTRARNTSHINWHDYFCYDEASPSGLRYRVGRGRKKAHSVAGRLQQNTKSLTHYWVVGFGSTNYMAHRIVWELEKYRLDEMDNIDHLSGNGEDNRLSNLAVKSHEGNCQNKKKQVDNTSGVTGVYKNTKMDRRGTPVQYWMASWVDEVGKQRTKCFRIDKLGHEVAFEKACERRAQAIATLTAIGKSYTALHGERV